VALQHMGGWNVDGISPTQQAQSRAAALAMGAAD
jgi:hypothetical protein